MENPDIWDFLMKKQYDPIDYEDKENQKELAICLYCRRIVTEDEELEWLDKENRIFRCPECDKEIIIGG